MFGSVASLKFDCFVQTAKIFNISGEVAIVNMTYFMHGQMLHEKMLHGQMLHGQMLHEQMLHEQMLTKQVL